LIEAVKQQQKQIAAQQGEVARLNRKVRLLQASLREDKAKQPITVALK
jgi:hypothetical protein